MAAQCLDRATFLFVRRATTKAIAGIVALVLLIAACGGDDSIAATSSTATAAAESESTGSVPADAIAIRASADIGLGNERLLVGIGRPNGERLLTNDVSAVIEVAPQGDPTAIQRSEAHWTWIVLNAIGLYRGQFDFDEPGVWTANLILDGGPELEPVVFEVFENPAAPALGEVVPVPPTPTLDDLPIEELTTDPDPDPAFYELSLAEAIANEQKTVLVFSTPAYCRTAACGPLLDNVKEIVPQHEDVNFVHVEVFTNLTDPEFAPDAAHLAPAVGSDWFNLPSEPWVFVLDPDGVVVGRFEGVLDPAELTELLG